MRENLNYIFCRKYNPHIAIGDMRLASKFNIQMSEISVIFYRGSEFCYIFGGVSACIKLQGIVDTFFVIFRELPISSILRIITPGPTICNCSIIVLSIFPLYLEDFFIETNWD